MLKHQCYRSGVSLHGHTSHSRESLRFLDALARRSALLHFLLEKGRAQFRKKYGENLDLRRAWWTPPLGPCQAWALEREQLQQFNLSPIVSLSDHDNATACLRLRASGAPAGVLPVSLEWSLPYQNTELHLGIHNIPAKHAVAITRTLNEYTLRPLKMGPASILEHITHHPGSLVVLNHPLWDESAVGEDKHIFAVRSLLSTCGDFIHALEWNGLRARQENYRVIALANAWSKPVVSGGDRHTLEANACINLTNAGEFSEFAEEVRDGQSIVMLMPTYLQPMKLRVTRMVFDVLSEQATHPYGWTRWSDRVFYVRNGRSPQSLASLLHDRTRTLRLLDWVTTHLPLLQLSNVGCLTTIGRCRPVLV